MVVLAPAMQGGRDASSLAKALDIPLNKAGFFAEAGTHLAPACTVRDGIFLAGCAQGPKDIKDSVAQGQAAAASILSRLIPGRELTIEPLVAEIDQELCSGCGVCVGLCPFRAIHRDRASERVELDGILCIGCGICAAACPGGAITARHYTDRQLREEVEGLVQHC